MKNLTFADRYPIAFLVTLVDITVVFLSAWIAYFYRFGDLQWPIQYKFVILVVSLVYIIVCVFSGVYDSWRGLSLTKQLFKVASCWVISFAILAAILVILKQNEFFSRIWMGSWFILGTVGSCSYKGILFWLLTRLRRRGINVKKVALVGTGKLPDKIFDQSTRHREYGFQVIERVNIQNSNQQNLEKQLKVIAEQGYVHEIWICLPLKDGDLLKKTLYDLRYSTAEIRFFPSFEDIRLLNHKATSVLGFFALDLSCSPMGGANQWLKRMEDIVLGIPIFILLLPVALIVIIAIKLSSSGPIVFKQYRNGVGGRKFKVYKFRTMYNHKEEQGKVTQATKGDSRITTVGAFLRKTSLDELPQFYNVLQGRMSIVGPRPHALEHNEYYKDLVESYMWRHKVKPGITGWAQVNGLRGETDTLEKMEKRVEFDLWYIENWSLWLDLKIIIMTVFKVFTDKNAY
jgi:putative colanic acid biosynthesis UDP-glucose lipid carrier transferase